jgi:hypothetical protein
MNERRQLATQQHATSQYTARGRRRATCTTRRMKCKPQRATCAVALTDGMQRATAHCWRRAEDREVEPGAPVPRVQRHRLYQRLQARGAGEYPPVTAEHSCTRRTACRTQCETLLRAACSSPCCTMFYLSHGCAAERRSVAACISVPTHPLRVVGLLQVAQHDRQKVKPERVQLHAVKSQSGC